MEAYLKLRRRRNIQERKKNDEEIDLQGKLILDVYNEGMSEEAKTKFPYLVIFEKIRFLLLQFIIAGLQLLNRSQATILLVVNFSYFGYFLYKNFKVKLFENQIVKGKVVIQEISIMFVLFVIWVFSMSEKSDFSTSKLYSLMETIFIVCIFLAAFSELFMVISEGVRALINKCKNGKENQVLSIKKGKVLNNKKEPFKKMIRSWKRNNREKKSSDKFKQKKSISKKIDSDKSKRSLGNSQRFKKMLGFRKKNKINFWKNRQSVFAMRRAEKKKGNLSLEDR
jgi:hypothetical protein